MKPMKNSSLPAVVRDHLAAVNAFDVEAIMATFADDALVYDNRREFWGREAIRAWIAKAIVGDGVTMDVTEVALHDDLTIVRARYDGNYDKTNLPPELILTNYFKMRGDKISTLIIVRVA
jgi:ketosteroid isomerase-like protein